MKTSATETGGFATLLPYETFRRFLRAQADGDAEANTHHEAYRTFLDATMTPALVGYMKQLRAAGRLGRMDGHEGHHFRFLDAWNAILDGATEDYVWGCVSHELAHWFLFRADYWCEKQVQNGEDFETVASEAWNGLVHSVETCVIRPIEFLSDFRCRMTGEALYIGFDNWKPSLWTFSNGRHVPAGPVEAPGIETVEVTFPTGQLLIADWLRIPAFTTASRAKDFDINCERGKREAVRWHAEKLGFAHVFVGNTSPRVLKHAGGFAVGRPARNEDADDYLTPDGTTDIGYVCTDLWWATIIDRETLLSILTKTMSRDVAESHVATYLLENDIIQVEVEPGRWHLSFCGDHEEFALLSDKDDLAPVGFDAFFTLTPYPETTGTA